MVLVKLARRKLLPTLTKPNPNGKPNPNLGDISMRKVVQTPV